MANNVFGGRPNAVVAKADISFTGAGINSSNTAIIYLVDDPLKSYVPGRPINAITGFELNKGYYMIPLTDMDLSSILVPPVSGVTPPSDTLEDLVFSPNTGLTNSGGNWTGAGTGWLSHGVANKKIAAGQNGFVQYRFINADQVGAMLGFNDVNEDVSYLGINAGFYCTSLTGSVVGMNVVEAGTPAAGPTVALNDYLRLDRTGSIITLKKSADGVSFTTIHTFTFSSSADLFIGAVFDGGTLRQPKGSNLTAVTGGGGTLEDIIFSPNTGLTNTGGNWTGSSASWLSHGVSTKYLDAGQNGYVQIQITNVDQVGALLGFNDNQLDETYTGIEAGFYITSVTGSVVGCNVVNSGSPSAGPNLTLNRYYRLDRTGTTITLKESTDGTTFTAIYTFAYNLPTALAVGCAFDGGTLRQPKGFNISTTP